MQFRDDLYLIVCLLANGPAAGGVFGFHGAAHGLGQAAGYREAEPDAGTVAWGAEQKGWNTRFRSAAGMPGP